LTLGQLESYSLLWTPLDTLGTHLLGTQGEGKKSRISQIYLTFIFSI